MEILPNGDIRFKTEVPIDQLSPETQHYLATCSKEELDSLALIVRDALVETFIDDFLAPLKPQIEEIVASPTLETNATEER